MRTIFSLLFSASLTFFTETYSTTSAEINGEVVGTQVIWDQAAINRDTDIVWFKDRWLVVCCEKSAEFSGDAALRVLSSMDGVQWESVALLQGPRPKPSYRYDPAFTIHPDGRLMISALGLGTFAWLSEDGQVWSEPIQIGETAFEYSRDIWNGNVALKYAHGSHDGNGSTIQFLSSHNGKDFQVLSEETCDFIPDDAAMLFVDETAYCVLSRQAPNPIAQDKRLGRQFQDGLLGAADAPYREWKWSIIDLPLCVPKLLPLPDQRIVAAVSLSNQRDCITLCEFAPASGRMKPFLEIPVVVENLAQTAYHRQLVGLAYHAEQLWLTYHATHNDKLCVHLAKVKLTQP